MGYQKVKHNSRLVFDPSYPKIDHSNFQEYDWTDFFKGAVEAIPCNAPPPRQKEVHLCMYLDSSHAGSKKTMRSRTSLQERYEHVIN